MKKSRRDPYLDDLRSQSEKLEAQIRQYEALIENEPRRLRDQHERQRTSMPAPDVLEERRREKNFYAHLSRGQLHNSRRNQTNNTVLLLLLVLALLAVGAWIYTTLSHYGIF